MKNKIIQKISHFDFIGKARYTVLISVVLLALGIGSLILKGGFDLGIDFAGGKITRIKIDSSIAVNSEKLRAILSQTGYNYSITNIGDEKDQEFLLSYQEIENSVERSEKLKQTLNQTFSNQWVLLGEDFVGPKIGKEFQRIGIMAAVISFMLLLVYIGFRFELKFGVAAVLATIHDALIALGFVSLFNFKFDTNILAGILTLIGYSVNDTIVIFDRIREESSKLNLDRKEYVLMINRSIVKTMNRTILTSLTFLMAVGVLIFFGGIELKPMAIILFLGLVCGTYSSIFIASPILVLWEKIFEKDKEKKKQIKKED